MQKQIENILNQILKNDGRQVYKILNDEINEALKNNNKFYISASHNLCVRQYAPLNYYYLLINKLNLKNECLSAGLSYEANSKFFSISWTEHDLIIALNCEGLKNGIIANN